MRISKENKTLIQFIQNSITTRKILPFLDLFHGIIQLFRGVILSCPKINQLLSGITDPFQREILSSFGIIHFFPGNIFLFQRIRCLFCGRFHSRRGIKLTCFGSFLFFSGIKPSLFGVFNSNLTNQSDSKQSKHLIYG